MRTTLNTNKTSHCVAWLYGLAALAVAVEGYTLQAQTWETVVDYQFVSGVHSYGFSLVVDASGNVFSGGSGYVTMDYSTSTWLGLVLQTDSTEASWLLSDVTNPDPNQYDSQVYSLGFGANGNVYSVGYIRPKCSTRCPGSSWYVRKTSDLGGSWTVADQFQYAPGKNAGANGFAADLLGNLYVAGYGFDKTGAGHWIVRKSADNGQTWGFADDVKGGPPPNAVHAAETGGLFVVGGQTSWIVRRSVDAGVTWSTVDTFQPSGASAAALGVSSDQQGNLYVVGNVVYTVKVGKSYTQTTHWVVRKSSNGGSSWATVDDLAGPVGTAAYAWGVGRDVAGNGVVVGRVPDTQSTSHWVVRSNSSGAWQTVDDFQPATGRGAMARGVVTDAAGNLLVTGSAMDALGTTHWIVRRLAPTP